MAAGRREWLARYLRVTAGDETIAGIHAGRFPFAARGTGLVYERPSRRAGLWATIRWKRLKEAP